MGPTDVTDTDICSALFSICSAVVDLEVLLREKGNYCFHQENFKNGYMVCIIYGEISEGSAPSSPLGSSTHVTD